MKILTPTDLKQTAALPEQSVWVVANLLRTNRQRISLFCGSPHAGKSTNARQLAIAVAQGKPFLGRDTLKSKVAYWQSEETPEDAAYDFEKSGMKQGDDIVILHPEPTDNHLSELDKCLSEDPDIRLVIIETLDDFLQMDDLSDNPSARRAFERFDKEVVSKHRERVSFLALHHFKKSDEQRGLSLNKILGATVIAGKTDCKIYLRQVSDTDPRRIISAQTRKGIPLEPTYLDFDEGTQTSVLGQTLADEHADAKKLNLSLSQAELRSWCLEVIAANPGLSQRAVCEKVGGKTKTVNDMLKQLVGEGAIVCQLGGATKTAHNLYLKGQAPAEQIPYESLPICLGCGINKVAGAAFNSEWGGQFCDIACREGTLWKN